MTDISALETYAGTLSEASQRSSAAAWLQHLFVHGDINTVIQTEAGPLPTLAKWRADLATLEMLLASSGDPEKGAAMVGWERSPVAKAVRDIAGMLSSQCLNMWEFMPMGMTYNPTDDPATWPDISQALIKSADRLAAIGGGRLEVPMAKYRSNIPPSQFPGNVLVDLNFSMINFYGVGKALALDSGKGGGGGFVNGYIEGSGTPGQHGVYLQGAFPKLQNFFIRNFTGHSLRLGDVAVAGAQWANIDQVHVWNQGGLPGGISGDVGVLVDGASVGLNPNSNLNMLKNIMVSGSFNHHVVDRGVGNKWPSLNVAWRQATGKTIILLEGSGTEMKVYAESADGTKPDLVVDMTSTSARVDSRRNDFVFSPGTGRNMASFIRDKGFGNEFTVVARGIDAGGTGSNNSPGVNLFANGKFEIWQSLTTPIGARGASPTVSKHPTGHTGGRSVKFIDVNSNSSLSFDLTPSASSLVNLPIEWLRGKTLTFASNVTADYQGPMLKMYAGPGNTGSTGEHTGNNVPQYLCGSIKIDEAATSVFLQLRSNNLGGGVNNGTALFNGIVIVIGSEIPKDLPRSLPESGGNMLGDLIFRKDAVNFADSSFVKWDDRWAWIDSTGKWRTSLTKPTVRDSGDFG